MKFKKFQQNSNIHLWLENHTNQIAQSEEDLIPLKYFFDYAGTCQQIVEPAHGEMAWQIWPLIKKLCISIWRRLEILS